MELIAVILMIAAGGAIALFVLVAIGIAEKNAPAIVDGGALDLDRLAASILYNILLAGAGGPEDALREIRRGTGLAAPVTSGIDISSWGERFAAAATREKREWLLEMAVKLLAERKTPVPLRQYTSLLDLSFALGFQTDALARLREHYGFEYIDHAKNARPREADRGTGGTPLFLRQEKDPAELLQILGIEGTPTRQVIISTYRRLATQHHPDRFYDQPGEVQSAAAARFIEITRAYEELLATYRD